MSKYFVAAATSRRSSARWPLASVTRDALLPNQHVTAQPVRAHLFRESIEALVYDARANGQRRGLLPHFLETLGLCRLLHGRRRYAQRCGWSSRRAGLRRCGSRRPACRHRLRRDLLGPRDCDGRRAAGGGPFDETDGGGSAATVALAKPRERRFGIQRRPAPTVRTPYDTPGRQQPPPTTAGTG